MARIQVVVAHPDDETFGTGSLLLQAATAGAATSVVCATRGEAGEGDGDLGSVREAELRRAAAAMGVAEVSLLGYGDSGMAGDPDPGTLAAADAESVRAHVRAAMRAFAPDVVVTLDASDSHRDHVVMRDAALAAAADLGVPAVYLCCLPRSLMRRWADHMALYRPELPYLDVDATAFGTPDDEITTVLDTSAQLGARIAAMALHASQTSPYDGLPDDLRDAFLGPTYLRRMAGDDDALLTDALGAGTRP